MLIATVSEPGIVGCALAQDGADMPADPVERIRVKLDVGVDGATSLWHLPAAQRCDPSDNACIHAAP